MCGRTTFLLASVLISASAAEIDSASLLARVRSNVLSSAKTMPRYVCRQKLQRQSYAALRKPVRACGTLPQGTSFDPSKPDTAIALPSGIPGYRLITSDQANLDVMLAEGTELFSWPGEGKFETNDPRNLLGSGFAGNGDFASFMITVFDSGRSAIAYLGPCPGPACVRYRYDVSLAASRYVVKTPLETASFAYHGTFDVDPDSAALLAATVIPTGISKRLPLACDTRTNMTYRRETGNSINFMIPESSAQEYLDANGWYFSNWIQYADCRQYTAQSTLTFGETARPTPGIATAKSVPVAGATLQLRLATTVDSERNSAGDAVEARLVRAVRSTDGPAIPAGTVVRGHLAQIEKTFSPKPRVQFALRFDTLVTDGIPSHVTLVPIGRMDTRGRGVFTFSRGRVLLDSRFVSRWRVR